MDVLESSATHPLLCASKPYLVAPRVQRFVHLREPCVYLANRVRCLRPTSRAYACTLKDATAQHRAGKRQTAHHLCSLLLGSLHHRVDLKRHTAGHRIYRGRQLQVRHCLLRTHAPQARSRQCSTQIMFIQRRFFKRQPHHATTSNLLMILTVV